MGGRRFALVLLAALTAVLVSSGVPGEVFAQPADPGGGIEIGTAAPAKDPKRAKQWLAAAQQLMQKASSLAAKNRLDDASAVFENAVIAFQKAIEAGDDVNVYLDLATAEDRLGRIDEAVKYLRRVVGAKAGVRPEVLKKAAARLDVLSGKVGLVTLTVTPAGASITLGGAEIGTAPLPESLVLMPGTYTLAFQADGFQPREAEISIDPGSESERTVALDPVKVIVEPVKPALPAPVKPAPALPEDRPEPPSKVPLYAGVGVTAAGVLGTGIFGYLSVRQHTTFTAASTSKIDREDARTNGQRFALISDVSLGTAVVAAGFTAYWYFYKYRSPKPPESQARRSPPAESKLDVVPWVQSRSGGITIAGWF